jgi:hypothetical protein
LIAVLIRSLLDLYPMAGWIAVFATVIVGLFALYVGIALIAILAARDEGTAKIRYKAFRGLLRMFRPGRGR